jgi:quercetin dioxygenase-like cupin family protein
MDIKRNGTQPSGKGPAEWFTGTVRIDPLFKAPDPARVSGASVTFEPGVRAGQSSKSNLAMSFGSRPARSTGTARRRP